MAATDIAAKIRTAGLAAIEKECLGEDFGFDCALTILQTPGGFTSVYTLTITKRSPLLGQGPLLQVSQIQSPDPSPADVEKAVTDGMRELRAYSAKLLTGQNGSAKALHSPN